MSADTAHIMRPFLKRSFDVVLATVGLVVLLPVLAALALWVRLDSAGPVFYRGPRVGRGGRPFWMLKFRTMVLNADRLGASSTAADDPRITRSGRFLRAAKMDELPQLWNVLLGEMSFVGPRPQVQWAVDLYTPEEREVLTVRPGITDFASIRYRNEGEILRGSVDPDRDYLVLIAPGKMRLGRYYVRVYSVSVDVRLIAATAGAVLGFDPDWVLPASGDVARVLGAPDAGAPAAADLSPPVVSV